ncbi:MAG: hypothetical protein F7C09_07660 [Aeropyrum sp.]|nr:hypothetical protein [Aeropyrum sp.]
MYSSGQKAKITPPTVIAILALVLYMLVSGQVLAASIVGLIIGILGGIVFHMPLLILWIAVPTLVVVAVFHGVLAAIDTTIRVLTVSLTASGLISMLGLYNLRLFLEGLGVPPKASILPVLIARQADIFSMIVRESLDSLRGRGIKGVRLLFRLPIPVLVNAFESSAVLAEAILAKVPERRMSTLFWRPTGWDVLIFSLTLLSLYLL